MATTKADEKFLSDARERCDKALEYWAEDREGMLDDLRFRAGDQWPEEVRKYRNQRPCLVVDKLNQYVRQIVNDGRQNRPSIKVRPVDGGADVATAEIFAGIIKHIEDQSNADAAYDTALEHSASGGFGFFRVLSEYVDPKSFQQDLRIRRIRNPLSVVLDPSAQEADGSDARFAFVIEDMPKEEFEATWPKATPDDWETDATGLTGWYTDTVRVAEYWWKEDVEVTYHRLRDGQILTEAELKENFPAGAVAPIAETRKIKTPKVKWCKVSGLAVLEEARDWPGKYIPIMVVWGNEIDLEGKVQHTGIIRPAKDAQRLYNYSRSAFAERVALTPKAPWVAAEGQVEDYEKDWSTANVENHSVLRYKPTSLNGAPVPPPHRTNAADIPAGFAQDMQISEHDIQGAIGMYNASLGAPSNERSGKAIQARQREGDVGTFHYHDNLNRAIRYCGRVLVDLIPHFYDTPRTIRILGEDSAPLQAVLNPTQQDASQTNGMGRIYNLGVGTYDVSISAGPSYGTMRQESAAAMIELVQANPALMQVAGDLIVEQQDWPNAKELAERLKLTLPPEIQQAEAVKAAHSLPPEAQSVVMQLQKGLEEGQQQLQQAEKVIQELQAALQSEKLDNEAKMVTAKAKEGELLIQVEELEMTSRELEIKAFEAETKRMDMLLSNTGETANAQPIESAGFERMENE